MEDTTTVVIVDDEEAVADLYATWVGSAHEVETAYRGEQALEIIGPDTDVVFLDRQMPGLSGDEVLEELADRGIDCRTVMVTAVDPDFDIIEMPFDDYLTKPVSREDLLGAIDDMLQREAYDARMQEYFSMASKKATLEAEKQPMALEDSDDYHEISQRVEELRRQADETVSEFDDFESAFRDLSTD